MLEESEMNFRQTAQRKAQDILNEGNPSRAIGMLAAALTFLADEIDTMATPPRGYLTYLGCHNPKGYFEAHPCRRKTRCDELRDKILADGPSINEMVQTLECIERRKTPTEERIEQAVTPKNVDMRNQPTECEAEHKYNELIMQVSKVHPGETRHQTALRYIRDAERDHSFPGHAVRPNKDGRFD
jgi:hypothetical protein